MTVNADVFRALLAMDSYNRGYNAGITGLGGVATAIGTATISTDSLSTPSTSGGQAAGFYGVAYTLASGEKVISYRGTDGSSLFSAATALDAWNGWTVAGGFPTGGQAILAIEFYKSVAGASAYQGGPGISLTGHSLGGGLAGFVAGLYGRDAKIFDNMPFQDAVTSAHSQSTAPIPNTSLRDTIYGSNTPWAPTVGSNISGYAVSGEVLAAIRTGFQPTTLDTGAPFGFWGTGTLGPVQRHSQAFLTILLYADKQVADTGWSAIKGDVSLALFDQQLAQAAATNATGIDGRFKANSQYEYILQHAIAYSAIDEGTRVFGDTGIRALFDDANGLGKTVTTNANNEFIKGTASDIVKIFVQYAGQLAIGQRLDTQNSAFKDGVLTLVEGAGGKLTVDLDPVKWTATTVNTADVNITGRNTLALSLFDSIKLDNAASSPGSAAFTDIAKNIWATSDSNNITRALFATGGSATIADTSAPNAKSGAKGGVIIAGSTGNDTLEGGDGVDLFAGGGGVDTVKGGKNNDFIFGGAGDDSLQGGLGADIINGGAGTDIADYADFISGRTFTIAKGDFNYGARSSVFVLDDATSDVDILYDVEEAKLGAGADTIRINPDLPGQKGTDIKFDGGGATGPIGDVLDFSNLTTGVKLISLGTSTDGASLVGGNTSTSGTEYRPDGSVSLDVHSSNPPVGETIRFTNFEKVIGTSDRDVFNLANLSPGGEATPAEQLQIDAAWAAFRAAIPPGAYVDRSVYNAAKSQLAQALLATRPYQSTLQVEGGSGVDIIKGSDTGISTLIGGADTDYLAGGTGFNILVGGEGSDVLVGDGLETQMDGGADSDILNLANGVFVNNGGTDDFAMLGGIRLTGGVQQWWMENGYAYYASTSAVASAALGIFGFTNLIGATTLLFDSLTMTVARYRMSAEGQLVIEFALGRAGQAVIQNYASSADTGESTAGVTVFRQIIMEGKGSLESLRDYIKSAYAAGFGINIFATDPLVLDLDGDGLELIRQRDGVYFDLDNDNFAENTAWVRPDDGFLVRDLNANGTIDNITEMFGNATTSGFIHLAALDSNADGKISSLDTAFTSLKVWRDLDSDGVTDAGELQTLTQANIKEISLTTTTLQNVNRGSAVRAEATFTRTDNTTSKISDVALEVDETDSKYLGNSTISGAAGLLPELRGYGDVTNLRIAMTNDATLLNAVTAFKNLPTTTTWQQIKDASDDILFRWASVDAVSAISMGGGTFDRQKLAFLEKYFGYQMTPRDGAGVPSEANIAELIKSWNDVLEMESLRLAIQGPLKTVFTALTFDAVADRIFASSPTALADTIKTAILQLSSTPATALSQWNTLWGPMLAEVFQSTDRSDRIAVKTDYAVQSLIKALDGISPALTVQQFVSGLGLQGVQLGTAASDNLLRGDVKGLQVFVGDGGNDNLTGGIGQDVYVYGSNFGQDTITDIEYVQSGDRIRFATLTANDVTMTRVGIDLVISVKNSTDKITIKDQFATPEVTFGGQPISPNYGVEEIQFADGKIYEAGDIAASIGLGTSGNDVLTGTGTADHLEGLAGNDILRGGDNGDTYYFGRGYGLDTIDDVMASPLLNAGDALVLVNGISARDVAITRVGASDDVTLTLKDSPTDQVTILGQFAYDTLGYNGLAPNHRVEAVIFSMGASWSFTTLQQQTIATYTTSGNDTTYGFGTPDDFFVSAGNDLLVGFDGGDVYRFGKGAGQDTIHDQSRYPEAFFYSFVGVDWSANDSVQFAAGLTASDVTFSRLGAAPDLTISINGTSDTLTIKDQFKGEKLDIFGFIPVTWFSRIENFTFANGTVLTWEQILNQLTTGTAGNDQLYGAYYRDTVDGKAGNDFLSGGDDGDTYLFGLGYGQDTIEDNQEGILTTTADKLKFGAGITVANTIFSRDTLNPLDLKITISGTTDTVTLKNQFDFLETGPFGTHFLDQVELFEWADGTIKNLATIVQEILAAAKTSGADSLYGTYGSETLDGGAGNDYLDGAAGSDVYLINRGNGNDVIHETNYAHFTDDIDTVRFGTGILPTDIALSRYGTNLLGLTATINAGGGSVSIDDQFKFYVIGPNRAEVERFEFANGTVWTANDIRLTYLAQMKTAGADTITGFATDDVIDGGAGNDLLNGINGSDTYVVGTGTGHDRITETTLEYPETSDTDTIQFGTGITAAQVAFSRVGYDLVLKWNGTADSITVTNQFSATGTGGSSWTDIEQITFVDGTKLNAADAANRVIAALATSGSDVINGSMYGERFDGLAGNDTLRGDGGGDTYVFKTGMGQDTIEESIPDIYLNQPDVVEFAAGIAPASVTFARVGNDLVASIASGEQVTIKNQFTDPYAKVEFFKFADGTVISAVQAETGATTAQATAGADTIIGTVGDDIIDGGAGNDLIKGGNGNDTIVFGRGSGQDTVNDNDSYPYQTSWNDRISFTAGVKPADVQLARSGDDLILTIAGATDQLTIIGQFTTTKQDINNHDRMETFVFADGTVWTAEDIDKRLIKNATTSVADTTVGYDSDDTFLASAGNDLLKGLYGNDTYYFGRGSGQDIINDNDVYHYSTSWLDKLVFGANIKASDLVLSRSGNDLVIGIAGTTDSVTIQGQFTTTKQTIDNHDRIETFVFDDGSTMSAQDIDLKLLAQASTAGADTIIGYDSDDLFVTSAGNDLMKGGYGNDSYAFGRGSGQDTIDDNDVYHYSTSWSDSVVFGPNVLPSDILVSRSGNDLILAIAGTSDQLTIKGQFFTTQQTIDNIDRIETFRFADGTIWSATEIDVRVLQQAKTSGADVIVGFDSADTLDGGAGNDTLKGGYGNDTFIFDRGYDQDTIDDNDNYPYQTSLADRVFFKTGIAAGDLRFARSMDDLVITIAGTTDQLTIKNQFVDVISSANNYDRIESFAFSDGSVVMASDVDRTVLTSMSTGGNDTIVAYNTDDTLDGGLGNDTLKGGYGNDTYIFGRGLGQDVIDDNDYYPYQTSIADKLVFKQGVLLGDLGVSRTGDDLVIKITGTTDQVTIKNQFADVLSSANNYDRIESFVLGDGSVTTAAALDALTLAQAATSGADTIVAYNGNETLEGKLGNDILRGEQGSDTYVYALGDGNDRIEEFNYAITDFDRVRLTNLNVSDMTFSMVSNDLIIRTNSNNQTITVANHFLSPTNRSGIEVVEFANGTAWNLARINAAARGDAATYGTAAGETLNGTAGTDLIFGEAGNDTINGAAGVDTLGGGDGADTLNGGLGSDTLYGDAGDDTLLISESASGDFDVIVGGDGTDTVSFAGFGCAISAYVNSTYYDAFTSDSTTFSPWSHRAIGEFYGVENVTGSAFADLLYGDDAGNILTGGGGNDQLDGGLGIDTASFSGTFSQYTITSLGGGSYSVSDTVGSRDGVDTIVGIERLKFSDKTVGFALPTVANALADQTVSKNIAMSFAIPGGSFVDPDGETVVLSASLASGAALPAWLTFNPSTATFSGTPPAGAVGTLDIRVTAADAFGTVSDIFALTVTNNAPPTITSNGGGATASISIGENGTTVTTVAGTDPDPGTTLAYAIAGGADASKFAINSATGALTFLTAPNFEAASDVGTNNVYDVIVQASDGSLTATQSIAVTVTNVNETPNITSNGGGASASVSVTENATAVTTVTATDPDAATTMIYSISGGADAAKFSINASSGALAFTAAPNFEAPTDVGANNVYDVIVQVSDGQLTRTQSVAVTVTNVNETPTITSNGGGATAAISIAENTTAVTTVTASDPDAGSTLTYAINGGADAAKFTINPTTGALAFVVGPDFEGLADVGANNVYDVIVQVSDGALVKTQALAVTVTDVNPETVSGTSGDDIIRGGALNDQLSGLGGNDTLDGGAGTDTLIGGSGNDIYIVDNAGDVVTESAGDSGDRVRTSVTYALASGAHIEFLETTNAAATTALNLTGNEFGQTITGNAGANVLNSGVDALVDTLIGGAGNDTYIVNTATDVVTETSGGGTGDRVQASVSYVLAAGADIEFLETTSAAGTTAINLTGNELAQTITGNAGANILNSGIDALVDTLIGGAGNDTYIVNTATDVVTETSGNGTADRVQASVSYALAAAADIEFLETTLASGTTAINLTGNALAQTITGNAGANTLDGGAGIDTMIGGAGDDIYIVDNASDVITETVGDAGDRVRTSVTYTLAAAADVEFLETTNAAGTTVINLTGNALANTIIGNAAANTLTGGGGNDTLDGGAGADTLVGGTGNDTYIVNIATDVITESSGDTGDRVQASVTYTLGTSADIEFLETTNAAGTTAINLTGNGLANTITGNAGTNTLSGGSGNDTLNGGAGVDTLIGGLGNDTFIVDTTTDTITENSGEGTDTVQSSVTFTIASLANLENITLTGSAAANATGNSALNTLVGNSGANVLNGGLGNDILTGGLGSDTFVFNSTLGASNIDAITDFSVIDDTFNLENTGAGLFTALTTTGTLAASAFWTGSAAHLASDRIIYNSATGDLFYDADGTGGTAQVKFATLSTGLGLTNADFLVI